MSIIFLQPVFQERIWGGTTLRKWFPDAKLGNNIGEAWVISAHPHGNSIVKSGEYKDMPLGVLYQEHPELFGYPTDKQFPLLVKILDAQDNLSVQVHPDDAYAQKATGERGKTECWYVLDAEPNANIILGHNARTKADFIQQVKQNKWEKLLRKMPIKKDDFFYIPSGTVHALGAGALVLEVQQSSDTTYRLYDYNRIDDKGKKRELHLQQALEVVRIPDQNQAQCFEKDVVESGKSNIFTFIDNDFFTVKKLHIRGECVYKRAAHYVLITVIDGAGSVNDEAFCKGDAFIIPATISDVTFNGAFDAILAYQN